MVISVLQNIKKKRESDMQRPHPVSILTNKQHKQNRQGPEQSMLKTEHKWLRVSGNIVSVISHHRKVTKNHMYVVMG